MKSIIQKISALLMITCAFFFLACEEKVEKPEITTFEANPTTQVIRTPVVFTIHHTGDYAALWAGDDKRDYYAYQEYVANIPADVEENIVTSYGWGVNIADTVYSITYKVPGVYKAILISSNVGDMGETIESTKSEITITITE